MLMELDDQSAVRSETFLGPARVTRTAGTRVELETPQGSRWATMALAYPYSAAAGDLVLAIGEGSALYVIGVLRGQGVTALTVPSDLKIHAPHGSIELAAARGVSVSAPTVTLKAGRLELLATTLLERAAEATRWIRGALRLRAGRIRTRVDEGYDLRAATIDERATDAVHIDGRKIHLG